MERNNELRAFAAAGTTTDLPRHPPPQKLLIRFSTAGIFGGYGMNDVQHPKVAADHLRRDAYLYVRQTTIRQVFENTESTRRQ